MTAQEFHAKFDSLPSLSRRTMAEIVLGLYAEAGFSDLTSDQLSCSRSQWSGISKCLIEAHLIWIDHTDVNGTPHEFIHATAHDAADSDNTSFGNWLALQIDMKEYLSC